MENSLLEAANFLVLPFMMCMIMAGIHCYLGFHVLTRGVIFVDLSLAQVAAFGASLALLLGLEISSWQGYFLTLGCTFLAALLFAKARRLESKVPQEAIIGIVYALGSAAVILVLDHVSHGNELIKNLLVGQVLWVTWSDLIKVFFIYGGVSLIHFLFRKQFLAASEGTLGEKQGLWDFAFYALFGVVITSSVSIAGVLQVFSYLVVPSVLANIWFVRLRSKLLFGWAISFILSVLGMALSYFADLPSGAAIVACFTIAPVLIIALYPKRA